MAALGFVFLMAFLPHLHTSDQPPAPDEPALARLGATAREVIDDERDVVPYPIHVDEHLHWVHIQAIINQEKVALDYDPYTGQETQRRGIFTLGDAVHERGFRLIVVQIHELTGVPLLRLFEFLPAAWLTFTAFGIYAVLRPHAAALPAAAFVALSPTTVRFMGPAFLVPIGFVLAWLPAALILAEPAKRHAGAAAILGLTVTWAFFVHLIGGFAAIGLIALGGLLGGVRNARSAVTLVVVTLAPLAWIYNALPDTFRGELRREEFLPRDFTIFDNYALVGLFAWAAGASLYALAPRERKSPAMTALVAGSAGMMALIVLGVVFDWGKYATYARWHPPFFLTASVPLAFGVVAVGRVCRKALSWRYKGLSLPRFAPPVVATIVGIGLVGWLVSPGVNEHLDQPYYRVINDRDWQRIEYINQNVGDDYQVFLMHPWKAPVMLAATDKIPYTVLYPGEPPFRGTAYQDYVLTGGTLEFYILNDVSLVVASGKPPLDEFVDLGHEGVWGLRPDIAAELAEIRNQEAARA